MNDYWLKRLKEHLVFDEAEENRVDILNRLLNDLPDLFEEYADAAAQDYKAG